MYRNHDNAFLVSDNDIARNHGHFATGNGNLNLYAHAIPSTSKLLAANHCDELFVDGAQCSPDGWWNVLLVWAFIAPA